MYEYILKPIFFLFNPEKVHDFMVYFGELAGKWRIGRWKISLFYGYRGKDISKVVDGIKYKTPILLSAGFDYNARLMNILPSIGLGGEEVGSVTARSCEGNPTPRLTRLVKSKSILVNKGLRNDGVNIIIGRLKKNRKVKDFVVGVSIERFWTLNSSKIAPRTLLAQVWSWLKNNQMDAAKLRELKQSSPLGSILAAGLSNSKQGRDVMKDSIQEAANQVIHDLEKYISLLGTIANVAPLLGLLGTVFGMIQTFNAIMIQGSGNTGALAGGISVALITTAAGLIVAIPATISHRYFQRRIDSIVVVLEEESIKLVDALHSERRVDVKQN